MSQDLIEHNKRLQESNRLLEERRKHIVEAGLILEEMGRVCGRTKALIGSLDKTSIKEVVESNRTISRAFQALKQDHCVLKTCACGKTYKPSEWFQLTLVGYQAATSMSGELRNCSCHSTLLVITKRKDAP